MGKIFELRFLSLFNQGRIINPLWLACSYAALTEMHFKMHIYKYACDRKIFRVLTSNEVDS